jgi:hypothetical protein
MDTINLHVTVNDFGILKPTMCLDCGRHWTQKGQVSIISPLLHFIDLPPLQFSIKPVLVADGMQRSQIMSSDWKIDRNLKYKLIRSSQQLRLKEIRTASGNANKIWLGKAHVPGCSHVFPRLLYKILTQTLKFQQNTAKVPSDILLQFTVTVWSVRFLLKAN